MKNQPTYVKATRWDGLPMTYTDDQAFRMDAKRMLDGWMQKGDFLAYYTPNDDESTGGVAFVCNECSEPTDAEIEWETAIDETKAMSYGKETIHVGDNIRSIETGWRGKVMEIENKPYQVETDGPWYDSYMMLCKHVSLLTDEVENDDTQWFDAGDTERLPRLSVKLVRQK